MPPDDPQSPRPTTRFLLAPFALVTCTSAAFCFLHRAIIPEFDPFHVFFYLRSARGAGEALVLTIAYYLPWLLPLAYAPAFPLIRRMKSGSQWDVAIGCVVALVIGFTMWPGMGT